MYQVLAEHGITTLDLLRQQPPARIEIVSSWLA